MKSENRYSEGPPWHFTGNSAYQIHLVKADVARRLIPSQLNIVEAFGYTLGGFFFAQYDSSPVGKFDELVAMAGIVWNPPTSCAWAARVYVNNVYARDHGIKEIGLPSKVAKFRKEKVNYSQNAASGTIFHVCDSELKKSKPIVMQLPAERKPFFSPSISAILPSFSGLTQKQPDLLHYTCKLKCRVSLSKPIKVISTQDEVQADGKRAKEKDASLKDVRDIMSGKPLLTIWFNDMDMSVKAPTRVPVQDGAKSNHLWFLQRTSSQVAPGSA